MKFIKKFKEHIKNIIWIHLPIIDLINIINDYNDVIINYSINFEILKDIIKRVKEQQFPKIRFYHSELHEKVKLIDTNTIDFNWHLIVPDYYNPHYTSLHYSDITFNKSIKRTYIKYENKSEIIKKTIDNSKNPFNSEELFKNKIGISYLTNYVISIKTKSLPNTKYDIVNDILKSELNVLENEYLFLNILLYPKKDSKMIDSIEIYALQMPTHEYNYCKLQYLCLKKFSDKIFKFLMSRKFKNYNCDCLEQKISEKFNKILKFKQTV